MTSIKTTLKMLKNNPWISPEWELFKEMADHDIDKPFPLSKILHTHGLYHTLYAIEYLPEHTSLFRRYAVWCARLSYHLMKDERSKTALDVAERYARGMSSDEELYKARSEAMEAARQIRQTEKALSNKARINKQKYNNSRVGFKLFDPHSDDQKLLLSAWMSSENVAQRAEAEAYAAEAAAKALDENVRNAIHGAYGSTRVAWASDFDRPVCHSASAAKSKSACCAMDNKLTKLLNSGTWEH